MKKLIFAVVSLVLFLSGCNDDDDNNIIIVPPSGMFTVTIENIQEGKDFFQSGTTDAVGPGASYSFSFHAGKGAYLSLATMFAQSNDLFYGFSDEGLALYDGQGQAVTGDVTSQLMLWDAGTEVNQEPGVGADQAPRQAGPNTGADENGLVQLVSQVNDGYVYPATSEVVTVNLSHDGGTMFTVTINNVSDQFNFQTPVAPGVWVVHNGGMPLFTDNQAAANGLEGLAEDGTNGPVADYLAMKSGYVSPFAPGVYAIHSAGTMPLFVNNAANLNNGLEAAAEDGDPSGLGSSLDQTSGVSAFGIFNTPVGAGGPAPIFPGESFEFSFDAEDGDYLSLASMLGQSNDLFFAFGDTGIPLFVNGHAVTGDVTSQLMLWDAGTEVNEYPGAGNNQAPRQSGPDTGVDENGVVQEVNDGFTYPAVSSMIRVTISFN